MSAILVVIVTIGFACAALNTHSIYKIARRAFGAQPAVALAALYLLLAIVRPWWSIALLFAVLAAGWNNGDWLKKKARSASASLTAIGEMVRRREIREAA